MYAVYDAVSVCKRHSMSLDIQAVSYSGVHSIMNILLHKVVFAILFQKSIPVYPVTRHHI